MPLLQIVFHLLFAGKRKNRNYVINCVVYEVKRQYMSVMLQRGIHSAWGQVKADLMMVLLAFAESQWPDRGNDPLCSYKDPAFWNQKQDIWKTYSTTSHLSFVFLCLDVKLPLQGVIWSDCDCVKRNWTLTCRDAVTWLQLEGMCAKTNKHDFFSMQS